MTEKKTLKTRPVILGKGGPTEAGWHSIESFLRCPKAFQFAMVRGLRKPVYETPHAFALGILHHAMRARWFSLHFATTESAMKKCYDAAVEEAETQKQTISIEAQRHAQVNFQLYVDFWSKRPRPKPVAAEYKLGPAPLAPGAPFFLYRTARLDDVSYYPEAGGQLAIGESKTTSTSPGDVENQYTLHGQTLLQVLLWKMCPNGEAKYGPVKGFVLDAFKKPYEKQKPGFGRVFVPVSDYALNWFANSMRGYLRAASGIDWNSDVPRNPFGCTYMAGRARVACEFRDLCKHGKSAASEYVDRDGVFLNRRKPKDGETVPAWE